MARREAEFIDSPSIRSEQLSNAGNEALPQTSRRVTMGMVQVKFLHLKDPDFLTSRVAHAW